MQSSICELHNQEFHECFPLHNARTLRITPSLPQHRIANRALAINRRELDAYWSWKYKLSFGFFDESGLYLAEYSRRRHLEQPPRDLAATNWVINFSPLSIEDDTQR